MKDFSKKEKQLGGAVLALSFLLAFHLMIFKPMREKLNSADDALRRENFKFRKYSDLEKKKDSLLAEYKKIEKYLDFKGSDNEKTAAVLSSVETAARQAGLNILDMKPVESAQNARSGRQAADTVAIYRVQMSAEGDMSKIALFLHGIADAAILFDVEKLSIVVKDENAGVMKMETVIAAVCLGQRGKVK